MNTALTSVMLLFVSISSTLTTAEALAADSLLVPLWPTFVGNWSVARWGAQISDRCIDVWEIRLLPFQGPHPAELIDHASGLRYTITDVRKISETEILITSEELTPYGKTITLTKIQTTFSKIKATTILGAIALEKCPALTERSPR